jgi:hypothetical protein
MATTTNYGWTTPDDTALVKDGASAIRTLGSSVDTTTKNLNPSTTLGDIEYRSSTANTNTRLGIGTTGQVLTVSGGVPSWATASSGGQTLISTTTLSGASITLSSIPQTYKHLRILVNNSYASATSAVQLRLNGDTTASNYYYIWNGGGSSYGSNVSNGTDAFMYFVQQQDTNTFQRKASAVLDLHRYTDTAAPQYVSAQSYGHTGGTGTGPYQGKLMNGIYNKSAAITSITILTDSGTFTDGTVYLYGVS